METFKALYLALKSKALLVKQEDCLDNLISQFSEEVFLAQDKNLEVFSEYLNHQLKKLKKTLIIGVHYPPSLQRNMMMASFK